MCFRINIIHISAFVGFNNLWIFRMHGATIKIIIKFNLDIRSEEVGEPLC
jgi:hypothetical protein